LEEREKNSESESEEIVEEKEPEIV